MAASNRGTQLLRVFWSRSQRTGHGKRVPVSRHGPLQTRQLSGRCCTRPKLVFHVDFAETLRATAFHVTHWEKLACSTCSGGRHGQWQRLGNVYVSAHLWRPGGRALVLFASEFTDAFSLSVSQRAKKTRARNAEHCLLIP